MLMNRRTWTLLNARLQAHQHKRIEALTPDPDERRHYAALILAVIEAMPEPCKHLPDALRIVAEVTELCMTYAENPELLTNH